MRDFSSSISLSRRSFLVKCGWVSAGVTVLSSCSSILPALPSMNEPEFEDAFSWMQILPDGRILFYSPRMEMGQGATLGLCQIIAEELNVNQSEIECILPNTDQTPPFKMTVGSEGIAKYFDPVSHGAATLREKLRSMAADQNNLPTLQIIDGTNGFILPNGDKVFYGELVRGKPLIINANELNSDKVDLIRNSTRSSGKLNAIGQDWKDPALEAIVTGKLVYSRDVILPNMLHGQVIQKPALDAEIQSVDFDRASSMLGVIEIMVDLETNFVGVIADNPFILSEAIEAIDVIWIVARDMSQANFYEQLDVEKIRSNNAFEHELFSMGEFNKARKSSELQIEARYDTSFAVHAAIEPRAAVARVQDGKTGIWCGSQDPFFVKKQVAKATGFDVDDVVVYSHRLGGGFGGRVRCQASEEAAILSAKVGQPVKVQWDRKSEFQNNYFQPAFSHYIDASVTKEGIINHWAHDFVSSPILTGAVPKNISWMLDMVLADKGTARGALGPYEFESHRVRYSDIRTAVPIGAWRGLGAAPNTFAIESMIDELASKSEINPLELRLKNLSASSDRLKVVLQTVARMADWDKSHEINVGRGIACSVYKGETAVAIIAEVRLDHDEQEIHVSKIWCVQDSGLVINPDQVKSQIMGNIVWGCSLALKEKITFNNGVADAHNFDDYEILRHAEAPDISIYLIQPENMPPTAVGEAAFGPVAPAIMNAIFDATKRRVRKLPLDYDLVFSNTET